VGWEVANVVFVPEQVNVQLKGGDRIGEVGVLDGTKEDPAARAIIVVEVLLALKSKMEEVRLSEPKDVLSI
jgi:hypothetical protein